MPCWTLNAQSAIIARAPGVQRTANKRAPNLRSEPHLLHFVAQPAVVARAPGVALTVACRAHRVLRAARHVRHIIHACTHAERVRLHAFNVHANADLTGKQAQCTVCVRGTYVQFPLCMTAQ